jgi:hypothetical protein
MSTPDRRALLDRDHGKLSIRRQCVLSPRASSGLIDSDWGLNEPAGAGVG